MPVNIKNTLGTINFTDFVHVIAAKVSTPTVKAWESWIDVPVTNHSFIIPNLDPENYYISFYDAPTNVALGTLVIQIIVNGLTGEFVSERRFYTVDGPGAYDPIDGATKITDPYLIGKNVTGFFKEGFRFFDPADEWTTNSTLGEVSVINGTSFSNAEKISLEIKYNAGSNAPSASGGGLYNGSIGITAVEHTLLTNDINKRVRCEGTAATQKILLPLLSSIAADNGFYFDNSTKGTAIQPKILLPGTDKIRFNGFMLASDLFDEFWVSKGEHLLLRKYDDLYWEVLLDYKGTNVGEKLTAGYKSHPNTLTENGQLIDGDEYPRLWWWINTVLPATHKYTTDTVTGLFTYDPTKPGQFALHSTLKKFRMPSTFGLSEKGLGSFETYGADTANRPIDYPGGFQQEMIKSHTHDFKHGRNGGIDSNPNGGGVARLDLNQVTEAGWVQDSGGIEQRVKNVGVVFSRRI